ncbi:hypothetical protein B0H11DRAFT_1728499, partial [Mycena galericulata]
FALLLLFPPSDGYCYGGSIYFTGMLVARLTGLKMSDYIMQANIFDPLGMKMSTFAPQMRMDLRERLLQMVCRTPEGLVAVEKEICDMMMSVHDLGVPVLADLIGLESKIFSPASVDLLFSPQLGTESKVLADLRGEKEKEKENYAAPAGIAGAGMPAVN